MRASDELFAASFISYHSSLVANETRNHVFTLRGSNIILFEQGMDSRDMSAQTACLSEPNKVGFAVATAPWGGLTFSLIGLG